MLCGSFFFTYLLFFFKYLLSPSVNIYSSSIVLGNSGETLHPRNVGFAGFHEISLQVMCENDSRIWLLRVNLLSVSGWLNLRRSGIMNLRSLEIVNL
jgi:hypothetical protein